MGILDKAKFWKKQDDDLGDLSNLGDFGLDDKQPPGGEEFGALPSMEPGQPMPGMAREEVQPTTASKEMSEQFGLRPSGAPTATAQMQQRPAQQQAYPQAQQQYPQQQYPSQYPQQQSQFLQHTPDLSDLPKDIEIIHAKLDSIKSSLDSINQRLATLERMASGENRTKYNW